MDEMEQPGNFIVASWKGYEIDSSEYFITVNPQPYHFFKKAVDSVYLANSVRWGGIKSGLSELGNKLDISKEKIDYKNEKDIATLDAFEILPDTISEWQELDRSLTKKQALALYHFLLKLKNHDKVDSLSFDQYIIKQAQLNYTILEPNELPPGLGSSSGEGWESGHNVPAPMFSQTPSTGYILEWYMDDYRYGILDPLDYQYTIQT